MGLNFKEIIELWIIGDEYISKNILSNLRIRDNLLVHFNTVIAEKIEDHFIINMTRYSVQTGRLQKQLISRLSSENVKIALKVPMDYVGTLKSFTE